MSVCLTFAKCVYLVVKILQNLILKKSIMSTVWWYCQGLPCCFRTCTTCRNWWNHEFTGKSQKSHQFMASGSSHIRALQQDNDQKHTSKFTTWNAQLKKLMRRFWGGPAKVWTWIKVLLILKFVWWCETCKCDKYDKRKEKTPNKEIRNRAITFSQH